MVEEHKVNKEEEPLMISKKEVTNILYSCDIDKSRVAAFEEKYDSEFGAETKIRPQNIVDTKQFEVRTANVTIQADVKAGGRGCL